MPENVLKPIFFKAPIIQEKENTTLEVIFAETVGKTCRTTNEEASPQKNKPCVFPWIDRWTKKINEGCAAPDGDEHGLWCPTKVNDDMEYSDGKGNWGYCNEKCLIPAEPREAPITKKSAILQFSKFLLYKSSILMGA